MYRLMKSEKLTLNHLVAGSISSYCQIQVHQFPDLGAALTACEAANNNVRVPRHYVLNESGEEYYDGAWIY